MGIKYLKGIYSETKVKTTRPPGLEFPIGLEVAGGFFSANSANTTTAETFDGLIVAGGGTGGTRQAGDINNGAGGGGGAGGVRLFSANSFNDISEYQNPLFTVGGTINFIPVVVGGGGGNSCFGSSVVNCRGGNGGNGGWNNPQINPSFHGKPGAPGGSGGGGGLAAGGFSGLGGTGIVGQGCNGATGGPGGSALATGSAVGGVTSSLTGTPISFGNGGCNQCCPTVANRGNGGGGAPTVGPAAAVPGCAGGSGIVAIRYRNPAAPTTPLATGGNCVCCTGDCIIHIFTSSGFLNVESIFSIN